MPKIYSTHFGVITLTIFAAVLITNTTAAAEADKKGLSGSGLSLDEQVQEIKTDVLSIAAALENLEEKLLYPSGTQVAFFVEVEDGTQVEIDSVELSIDGQLVAHHIYSFKEVEALGRGGVQRLYTGNTRTGAHRADLVVKGKLSNGSPFKSAKSLDFEKQVDPKLLGIKLSGSGEAQIEIGSW